MKASHDKAIQTLVQMETLELVLLKDDSPMPNNTVAGEGVDGSDDTPANSPGTYLCVLHPLQYNSLPGAIDCWRVSCIHFVSC